MIAIWRSVAAVIVGLGLIYGILDTVRPFEAGDIGVSLAASSMPGGFRRVVAVEPRGSADRAGIALGDAVYQSAADVQACPFLQPRPGNVCPMSVLRDGVVRRVALRAAKAETVPWYQRGVMASARLSFLLMAALLAWKRSDDAAARPRFASERFSRNVTSVDCAPIYAASRPSSLP